MKKSLIKGLLLLTTACLILSYDLPKGWFRAGSDPDKYDMGIAPKAGRDGKNVATIQSTAKKIHGFGTLMQNCLPEKYLGKRVKMTGYMKSVNVSGWAGFWFRVDGPDSKKSLSFDNMYDRAVRGTSDWKQYEITLDVPKNSSNLAYGALLHGTGQIWFDDIKFEIVNERTQTTQRYHMAEPTNLNFED